MKKKTKIKKKVNKVVILFIVLILVFMTIISVYLYKEKKEFLKEYNEKYYVKETAELNEADFLQMTIKPYTLSQMDAVIIIKDNGKCILGRPYYMEEKINGEWLQLERKCQNCVFASDAFGTGQNNKKEMHVNFGNLYGKLDSGEYRIVKDCLIKEENKEYLFSVEFIIK